VESWQRAMQAQNQNCFLFLTTLKNPRLLTPKVKLKGLFSTKPVKDYLMNSAKTNHAATLYNGNNKLQ
jgi:hypothetical protein